MTFSLWIISALHSRTLTVVLCKTAQVLSGYTGIISEHPFFPHLGSSSDTPGHKHCWLEAIPVMLWLFAWAHCLAGKQIVSQVACVLHTASAFAPGFPCISLRSFHPHKPSSAGCRDTSPEKDAPIGPIWFTLCLWGCAWCFVRWPKSSILLSSWLQRLFKSVFLFAMLP